MGLKKIGQILLLLGALILHKRVEAINFPAALDDNTTLTLVQNGQVYVASLHNNLKDAIIAAQTKIGVDGSAVPTTLDYLVKNSASVDPGHSHTSSSFAVADGSAASPGLRFGNPVTDTNTGLFHPGVGVIAISSAGTEVVRVNGTGLSILDAGGADFPLDVAGTVRIQGSNSLCFGGTGAGDNDTCVARSAAHVATLTGSLVNTDVAVGDHTLTLNGIAAKTGTFLRARFLPADANPFFDITAAGVVEFGAGGASAVDVNLYRSASDVLKTDDSLTVDGTSLTLNNDSGGVRQIVVGTANGLKIGTATTQKLGFFNATPVVQPLATAGLLTSLQNLGLIASGTFSGDITTTGTVNTGGLIGAVQTVTMANGANSNFSINAGTTTVRITGPTGAFSISGFASVGGNVDGRIIHVISTVSQTLTITNDATSTAANRLLTGTLADIGCTATEPAAFTAVYDGTTTRWRVVSTSNCVNP
jgi:hypothetical protein